MFLVSIVSVLFIKIKASKRNTFNEPSESIFSLKVLNLFSKSWITVPKNDFRASKTLSPKKSVDNPWLHLQFWLWNQKYFFFKIFPQKFWISKKGGIPPLKGKKNTELWFKLQQQQKKFCFSCKILQKSIWM